MDDKLLPDLLSKLMPDALEGKFGAGGDKPDEQNGILIESLKAVASQSGEPLKMAVDEFLNGKGALHATTQAALAKGSDSSMSEVVTHLISQFKLSPTIARLIASLLAKLLPSTRKEAGTESVIKKTTRRKAKTASVSAARKKVSSSLKKPVRKSSRTPKTSTSKPAAKKKPASRTGKKGSA